MGNLALFQRELQKQDDLTLSEYVAISMLYTIVPTQVDSGAA